MSEPGDDGAQDPAAEGLPSAGPNPLALLKALVRAHAVVHPNTGAREPILYLRVMGGAQLQHHGLRDTETPDVDDALLEEMHNQGVIDIDIGRNTWRITPTMHGREVAAAHERVSSTELAADVQPLLDAVAEQAKAGNKLAWPAVRPVLAAFRDYWEAGGFSPNGIQLAPLLTALPQEHAGLFSATVRTLERGNYIESTGSLSVNDLPAEVELTDRTHEMLDGWPGAAPEDLVENLLAVLATRIEEEPDASKKRRLEKLGETVRELGTSTAAEVLAKVLLGG